MWVVICRGLASHHSHVNCKCFARSPSHQFCERMDSGSSGSGSPRDDQVPDLETPATTSIIRTFTPSLLAGDQPSFFCHHASPSAYQGQCRFVLPPSPPTTHTDLTTSSYRLRRDHDRARRVPGKRLYVEDYGNVYNPEARRQHVSACGAIGAHGGEQRGGEAEAGED